MAASYDNNHIVAVTSNNMVSFPYDSITTSYIKTKKMPIRPECNNTKVHKSTSWMTKPNPLRTRRCVSGGGRRRRLAQTEWCWKPALMDVLWSIDIQQPALHRFVTVHNSRDEGVEVLFGTLYLLLHLFLVELNPKSFVSISQLMCSSISVFSHLFNYFLPNDQRRRLAQ